MFLPIDVVVDGEVVRVVIIVGLVCPDLAVPSSHHQVAVLQEHLTHTVLRTRRDQQTHLEAG